MFSRIFSPAYRMFTVSATSSSSMKLVESAISHNQITVFSKTTCPFCTATKRLFSDKFPDVPVKILELDLLEEGPAIQAYLAQKTGQRTVPNVFVNSQHIGGNDTTQAAYHNGKLSTMLQI
ncbi:thioredoxin-like protein [Lentinula edodes]|nr:thioredoxin-like protein [Lentinula edodes]